jgi:hypothetical protein
MAGWKPHEVSAYHVPSERPEKIGGEDMSETTASDKSRLSTKQLWAVSEILSGKNDTAVAKIIGVSRQTICDWRNHNCGFQAALNAERAAVWESYGDRLRKMGGQALSVIEAELEGGSLPAALAVLRTCHFQPGAIGPSDIRQLKDAEFGRSVRLAGTSHPPNGLDGQNYQQPENTTGGDYAKI